MEFTTLIDTWPQFLQHIIINDIAPFNELIKLAQTCSKLRSYFYKIKAYYILCNYQIFDLNIFRNDFLCYDNHHEKQLFQKIYVHHKNKISLDLAIAHNYKVILDYYADVTDKNYTNNIVSEYAINRAASNGYINVLNWVSDNIVKYNGYVSYTYKALDNVSANGYIDILDWFFEHTYRLHLINISATIDQMQRANVNQDCPENWQFELGYTEDAVNNAAANGHVNVLNWWYEISAKYGVIFRYTELAINKAAANGHINVLEWFYNHSSLKWLYQYSPYSKVIKFRYTSYALDKALTHGFVDVLVWFLSKKDLEIKYSGSIIDYAAEKGHVGVLDTYLNHMLNTGASKRDIIYSHYALDYASVYNKLNVLNWFSSVFIKHFDVSELKYSSVAIDCASAYGHLDILEWWNYMHFTYDIHLEYTTNAIDLILNYNVYIDEISLLYQENELRNNISVLNENKYIEILDWWLHSGLELIYTTVALDKAIELKSSKILNWWLNSTLELKYTKKGKSISDYIKEFA